MESLEERQLLSVTNALDDSVAEPFSAPFATVVAQEPVEPVAFSLSTLEIVSAKSETNASSPVKISLELPESLTRNEEAVIKLTYENSSAKDVAAPLLMIGVKGDDGQEGALLTLDNTLWESDKQTTATPAGFSTRLQILASGDEAGVLKAGETVVKEIYWGGWLASVETTGNYNFSVGMVDETNAESLPLETWRAEMKPDALPEAAWNGVWNRLSSVVGETWGDYVLALNGISKSLAAVGSNVVDANKLLSIATAWASDSFNPLGTTASSTDAYVADGVLSFSVQRSRQDASLALRDYDSVFGLGWDWNWSSRLMFGDEGVVSVVGPFGVSRSFQPATLPGETMAYNAVSTLDSGVLTRASDRSFELKELDGTVYRFAADGTLISTTDANGVAVVASYASGRLTKLTSPFGATMEIAYNAKGKIAAVVDSNGNRTVYNYDETGARLVSVDWADGRSISYVYDEATGALAQTTYADKTTQTFLYDQNGFLTATTTGEATLSYVFGTTPETILSYETFQNGEKIATTYLNDRGAVAKTVDALGRTTTFGYDAAGLLRSVSNGETEATFAYDAAGNVVESTDGTGATLRFAYDGAGRLTKMTDALGRETTFVYDANGNLLTQERVDGTAAVWTYGVDGLVASYTARSGDSAGFVYDASGNIVETTYSTEANSMKYEYDDRGNLTKIVDFDGSETVYVYDDNDALLKVEYANGRSISYAYDEFGRQISTSAGDDYRVEYTYDANGWLDKVIDAANGDALLTDYDYDSLGRLTKETRGNGTYVLYAYDATGALTEKSTYQANGDAIASFAYTYDVIGQIEATTTLDGTWSYAYDAVGQLTSAVFVANAGSSIADQSYAYEYDAAGNRVAETVDGVRYEYSYDAMNRLLSDGRFEYSYDANGNMTTKTNVATGEVWTYAWNQDGEMISATSSTGEKFEYEYDAAGNKTAVVHTAVDGSVARTEYLIDPTGEGDVAAEYDAEGNLIATYAYGLGLTSKTDATGAASYYAFDMLGSTAAMTDATGAVLNEYAYNPFGGAIYKSETVDNMFEFVGEYGVATDQNDALISMRARWYDPATGRFVSEDPLGYAAGDANLYRYCGNAVTISIDPSGLLDTGSTNPLSGENLLQEHLEKELKKKAQKEASKDAAKKVAQETTKKLIRRALVRQAVGSVFPGIGNGLMLAMTLIDVVGTAYSIYKLYHEDPVITGLAASVDIVCEESAESDTPTAPLNLTLSSDLSGSMSDDIDNVKHNSKNIVNSLQDSNLEYSVTVMDYCDSSRVQKHETANTGSIMSGINSWDVDNNPYDGGTECANSMLMSAINRQTKQDAANVIVVMTDEPCDPSDPIVKSDVIAKALETDTAIFAIIPESERPVSAATLAGAQPSARYYWESTYDYWSDICAATGGKVIFASNAEDTAASIIEAIYSVVDVSTGVYRARNVYYGQAHENIALTATLFDSSETTSYRWDFDDDGLYDATTETATVENAWLDAGSHRVRVQAVKKDGTVENDTLYVDVRGRFGEVVPTCDADGNVRDLYVYGWCGDDELTVKRGAAEGTVAVCVDPTTGETFEYAVAGKIVANAYDGANAVGVEGGLADEVFVYGGTGDDVLTYDRATSVDGETWKLSDGFIVVGGETVVYDGVDRVAVRAGAGADAIEVQASEKIAYDLNGSAPTSVANGDSLTVRVAGAEEGTFELAPENSATGVWTNASFVAINYVDFESCAQSLATKLSAPYVTLCASTSRIDIAWEAVENATGYVVEYATDADFQQGFVAFFTTETKASLDFPQAFSRYFCRVKALGTGDFVDSDWSSVVETEVPEVLNVPKWKLADYAEYDEFVLDATTDSNVTATLYGKNADGGLDVLKAWDFVGYEAVATIAGQSKVAESLTITAGAASLLAEINFDGGSGRRDSIAIAGTANDDTFALGTETVETTTPVYQSNPYEKLLRRYAEIYGKNSSTYLRLKDCYDAAYARLQKCVVVKTATWGVVDVTDGAAVKFNGVKNVAIDAGDGNDYFKIDSLNFTYSIVGGNGSDTLDFSKAKGRLNLDMNADYRQVAIIGDGGTLRLVGDVESVVGTVKNDRIVGGNKGLTFFGNGGSDSVTLSDGNNYVELVGPRQSVVVRGGSSYVGIDKGDYSVVNVVGNKTTRTTLEMNGNHISLFGGHSVIDAAIVGDYVSAHCGSTAQTTVRIEGKNANVVTGAGADSVVVIGDRATIRVGGGDDQVWTQGAFANVDLGAGNDVAFIEDGDAKKTGGNIVLGGVGNDFIFVANASGTNYLHAGLGNDVVVGSTGNDYIYANGGNNVLFGLAGVDRLFGGAGRDALIASRTSRTTDLETKTRDEVIAWYAELYENWAVDDDLEATLETLGGTSDSDGEKDWIYRGGGKRNLIFASALDGDFENALERSPFRDELRLD